MDPAIGAKRAAAYQAVDDNMKREYKAVGVGSGSTVVFAVERLAQLTAEGKISSTTVYIPTSFQSRQLLNAANLTVRDVDVFKPGDLDVVFDGADEIDSDLNCIKGGGGCLLQEKLVGLCARKFIITADESKVSSRLGERWKQGVPIEIVPLGLAKVTYELEKLGGKVMLRSGGKSKAGPCVTDNGNFILDTYFGLIEPSKVHALDQQIKLIVGVVETGLFTYAKTAYIGKQDGTYTILS